MSILTDVLDENRISVDDVVRRSGALESHDRPLRALAAARRMARGEKKAYDELKIEKPARSGRGVGKGTLAAATAGRPVTGQVQGKILRAVNSLLASGKKDSLETAALFGDVPAKKKKIKEKKK